MQMPQALGDVVQEPVGVNKSAPGCKAAKCLYNKLFGTFVSNDLPVFGDREQAIRQRSEYPLGDVECIALGIGGIMYFDEFVKARNAYSYPPVGLVHLHKSGNFPDWRAAYYEQRFVDTLRLDEHHFNLLSSSVEDEVILGLFSVMFWGYKTSGAVSVARCNWLAFGKSSNPKNSLNALGKSLAVRIVRQALEGLRKSDYSGALREIRKLPHVGVSFGTKYLAFLDPENVGVLDDKITKHLSAGTFTSLLGETVVKQLVKPTRESTIDAENRFSAFCLALNKIKDDLNSRSLAWSDASGAEMARFRAVDVERALFAIAKAKA